MNLDKDQIRRVVTEVVREKLGGAKALGAQEKPVNSANPYDGGSFKGRELITESDVIDAHRDGRAIHLSADAIMTPSARDAIARYEVEVITGPNKAASLARVQESLAEPSGPCVRAKVAVASDHGGFAMKQILIRFLEEEAGIPCHDLGTSNEDAVDYPDFASAVARAVSSGECCRGIVVDGAGIGSAMAANKISGIRAAHCSNVVEARNAREHNDANVLTLGGRMIGEQLAQAIAIVFLKTDFGGGRHQKRIDKITSLER